MKTNNTTEAPGRPLPFETVRSIFRQHIFGGEFWVAFFDDESQVVLDVVEALYYRDPAPDFDKVVVQFAGEIFTLVAMRKTRMRRWEYERLLKSYNVELPPRDRIERDGLLCVTPERMPLAIALADNFRTTVDDLAMGA